MQDQLSPPSVDELIGLGVVLGENRAFGLVAGRCSAAQAETIRRLRIVRRHQSTLGAACECADGQSAARACAHLDQVTTRMARAFDLSFVVDGGAVTFDLPPIQKGAVFWWAP